MMFNTFKRLANILRPYIIAASGKKGITKFIPNEPILPDVRLVRAIHWFAGGSLYDIMITNSIGHTDTINSCWKMVDALNKHFRFAIKYPDDHGLQHSIADGFHKVSGANFQCCAGAIDGILIWIHRPSDKDCEAVGCSPGKFMGGRKKKFGLNCQAVCNVRERFLGILIVGSGHFGSRIVHIWWQCIL
jgi:hypothetical protein